MQQMKPLKRVDIPLRNAEENSREVSPITHAEMYRGLAQNFKWKANTSSRLKKTNNHRLCGLIALK